MDEQQLKKLKVLKNAHKIHRQRRKGGGQLKKYKNKLHKGSSASLLAKYLGRFCNFVCFASVSPGKVCRSSRGTKTEKKKKKEKSLCRSFVHDDVSTLSLQLGAKSTVMADLVLDEANLVLSNQRGRKDRCPCSARTSALIVTIPIFTLV